MGIVTFMASTAGRMARIIAGIVLFAIGFMVGGTAGWVIGIVGLVAIAAGAADVCLVAPLFGAPFKGAEVRRR